MFYHVAARCHQVFLPRGTATCAFRRQLAFVRTRHQSGGLGLLAWMRRLTFVEAVHET